MRALRPLSFSMSLYSSENSFRDKYLEIIANQLLLHNQVHAINNKHLETIANQLLIQNQMQVIGMTYEMGLVDDETYTDFLERCHKVLLGTNLKD